MSYRGRRVLVTGGAGFIGSNLAIRLVEEGALVTVVDSLLPGCGGNAFNLEPVRGDIRVLEADIADTAPLEGAIRTADVIFNLAGEISHIHSMMYPERDLQVNTVAQLRFLLACREQNRGVRIVYAGTRQVYGVPEYLPVDERHPIQPVDFNGVHKYAATMYHHMLSRVGDIDAVVLRLTNVYGPRMALDAVCQGFLSVFFRCGVLGNRIEVYGDGMQLRDPLYVEDAVRAFLLAGAAPALPSRSYNTGGPCGLPLLQVANIISGAARTPSPRLVPFPDERKPIDIGSYVSDSTRIAHELGFRPRVEFEAGAARTLDYFSQHLRHYLDPDRPVPACRMPEHSGVPWRLRYAQVP